MKLDSSLGSVPGIGPRRCARLAESGFESVEDLLRYVPVRYEDRRRFATVAELAPDRPSAAVLVTSTGARLVRTRRRGFTITEAEFRDASGAITAVWYNQPYLARAFPEGRQVVLFGRPVRRKHRREPFVLENPDHERLDPGDGGIHTGRVVPVYRKLAGVGSKMLRRWTHAASRALASDAVADPLPDELRRRLEVPGRVDALRTVHFPTDDAGPWAQAAEAARRRLALEDLYFFQLVLAAQRSRRGRAPGRLPDRAAPRRLAELAGEVLPFTLTSDQERALGEIAADLASERPMGRLLQGDVGSGKTAIAVVALLRTTERRRQGALLAPTSVLARQHAERIAAMFDRSGRAEDVALLTGAARGRARAALLERIASGNVGIVVGTHALLEEAVRFRDLATVVIDEQHRFGVAQRAALLAKSRAPDVLVMTATPIPRSLALTLYGDLDVSVLRERPPGRTAVSTVVRASSARPRVHAGLRREVERGRQAIVVLPRVDAEDGASEIRSVERYARSLRRGVLADTRIAVLHGRLAEEDKVAVMRSFEGGAVDVLVATTVIEVGIDVPNATVLVVEHAERFGLAQLHQMRGRVGRGHEQGHCVLLVGEGDPGEDARTRLAILERSSDGFEIAERDLEMRGPGAVFSTRQHGVGDLRFLGVAAGEPETLADLIRFTRELADDPARMARALEDVPPAWRRRMHLPDAG